MPARTRRVEFAIRPAAAPAAATSPPAGDTAAAPSFAEVDVASLQFTRPRSVGVEAVGMAAFDWLGIDRILFDLGFTACSAPPSPAA